MKTILTALLLFTSGTALATTSTEIDNAVHGLAKMKTFNVTLIAMDYGNYFEFGSDYRSIGINSLTDAGVRKISSALQKPANACPAAMVVSLFNRLSKDPARYAALAAASYRDHLKKVAAYNGNRLPRSQFYSLRVDLMADTYSQFEVWNRLSFSENPLERELASKISFDLMREPIREIQIRSVGTGIDQSNRFQRAYQPMQNFGTPEWRFEVIREMAVKNRHPEWQPSDLKPQVCRLNEFGMEMLLGPDL
jgi:hypothetical protein